MAFEDLVPSLEEFDNKDAFNDDSLPEANKVVEAKNPGIPLKILDEMVEHMNLLNKNFGTIIPTAMTDLLLLIP